MPQYQASIYIRDRVTGRTRSVTIQVQADDIDAALSQETVVALSAKVAARQAPAKRKSKRARKTVPESQTQMMLPAPAPRVPVPKPVYLVTPPKAAPGPNAVPKPAPRPAPAPAKFPQRTVLRRSGNTQVVRTIYTAPAPAPVPVPPTTYVRPQSISVADRAAAIRARYAQPQSTGE